MSPDEWEAIGECVGVYTVGVLCVWGVWGCGGVLCMCFVGGCVGVWVYEYLYTSACVFVCMLRERWSRESGFAVSSVE